MRLSGKSAVITGAGSGIGRAMAALFAAEGASVLLADWHAADAESATAEIRKAGGTAESFAVDVSRREECEAMVERAVAAFGRIDILVNNAAAPPGADRVPVVELPEDAWHVVLETNLTGTYLVSKAVASLMVARGTPGRIINISSNCGKVGYPRLAAYCASKFGVIGLTESLAEEVRADGVRVHVVLPDAVETSMWEQNGPIGRPPNLLAPSRVADFIVYLLTLPEDTVLVGPVIAPVPRRRRAGGGRPPAPADEAPQRETR